MAFTKTVLLGLCLALLALSGPSRGESAPLTNADVIKMLNAGLAPETVRLTVRTAPSKFDTSPDGLIALKQAGVDESVVEAMISAQAGGGAPAGKSGSDTPRINPEEIMLVDEGQRHQMRYTVAQVRTAARAMGWGGVGTYAVLNGPQARLRISNPRPAFDIAVPGNAQPESYLTLASFAVRRNNTREVLIGGGYRSYSTGIHPDRIVPTRGEPLADQSGAPDGFTLFRVTPDRDLAPGEYALVTYNSQVRVLGFFASGNDSYFDFGVD